MKASSTGKYMFADSSDNESVDSDDEKRVEWRKRRERAKTSSTSLRIPILEEDASRSQGLEPANSSPQSGEQQKDDDEVGLFVIDSTGGAGKLAVKNKEKQERQYTQLDPGVDLTKDLYIDLDCLRFSGKEREEKEERVSAREKDDLVDEMMKKATFKPALEKTSSLPLVSRGELKRQRKAEREKTKGRDWFNMPATEMTEERKRDLEIMQFRDVLDPKSRYKKDDRKVLPKYFQIGTIVEDPTDFYHSRVPRKERKQTIVDELLADAEFQKRSKRKYAEISQEKSRHRGKKKSGGKKTKTTKS